MGRVKCYYSLSQERELEGMARRAGESEWEKEGIEREGKGGEGRGDSSTTYINCILFDEGRVKCYYSFRQQREGKVRGKR